VVQSGRCFGFALKTAQDLRIVCQLVGQELQSDETAKLDILGLIDNAHSPTTEFPDDVVVRDGLPDHGANGTSLNRASQ
jgi:hypothetical protein